MKRSAGMALAMALACAWPVAAANKAAPETDAPNIGAVAPTALGKDGKNKAVDLSGYRGKVVIVTFWASWCGYCLKELPALNDLQAGFVRERVEQVHGAGAIDLGSSRGCHGTDNINEN